MTRPCEPSPASQTSLGAPEMKRPPEALLRFFETGQYARQFIQGRVRFGRLDSYREIEGPRRDEEEGRVSVYWNQKAPQLIIDTATGQVVGRSESDQDIHYSGCSANPYSILSTAHPESDRSKLAADLGRWVVCIKDPTALLERIRAAWKTHPWALAGEAFIVAVTYNRDGLLDPDPYLRAPAEYSYSQKRESDRHYREFRYVLTSTIASIGEVANYLTLKLPDCSDICNLT